MVCLSYLFSLSLSLSLSPHHAQDTYKLVFDAALVFLESFDTYANFQNI